MTEQRSTFGLIFILGFLSMLMPLAIDMYLPALPLISQDFQVSAGAVQMTLNSYVLGFAIGQLFYGPLSDSLGRKPIILFGITLFAIASLVCVFAVTIDDLIWARFFQGLAASAASVVISALMRDRFPPAEFAKMMSYVILVMTFAPLIAPMLGGVLLLLGGWKLIFMAITLAAIIGLLLVIVYVEESLPLANRHKLRFHTILTNFVSLFRHRRILSYMLASGFSFAGLFSFLTVGPFIYIDLNGVAPQHFGYYFALNIIFLMIMTWLNGRCVKRLGSLKLFQIGLTIQVVSICWMAMVIVLQWPFITLALGVAAFVGCVSIVTSNAMAIIMREFPHMAGTVSSLAGTIRFGIGGMVGVVLTLVTLHSAWPMVLSMASCLLIATLLSLYAKRQAS